jgi:hypothetical protein
MCTKVEEDLIRQETGAWMQRGKSFTSVDIANAIKQRGTFIKNRDVANFLRNTAVGMSLQYSLDPYVTSVINVQLPNGSWVEASLYHPQGTAASDYKNIKQKALSPDEAKNDNPFSATEDKKKDPMKFSPEDLDGLNVDEPQRMKVPLGNLAADLKEPGTIKMLPGLSAFKPSGAVILNIEYVEHLHIHLNE